MLARMDIHETPQARDARRPQVLALAPVLRRAATVDELHAAYAGAMFAMFHGYSGAGDLRGLAHDVGIASGVTDVYAERMAELRAPRRPPAPADTAECERCGGTITRAVGSMLWPHADTGLLFCAPRYAPGHYDGDGCTFPDGGHFL
jgi:hypothetical protein